VCLSRAAVPIARVNDAVLALTDSTIGQKFGDQGFEILWRELGDKRTIGAT
jgi:hypothetical protein